MKDNHSPYEIVKAAAAGDKKAMEFLINRYSDYIDELIEIFSSEFARSAVEKLRGKTERNENPLL